MTMTQSQHVEYLDKAFEMAEQRGWMGPGFYFWDEVEYQCYGPHKSYQEACRAMLEYAKYLNRGSFAQ
jgi:hypothetical protein